MKVGNLLGARKRRKSSMPRPASGHGPTKAKKAKVTLTMAGESKSDYPIVVLGQSTGGPIPHIPSDFPAPLLIIQHMPGTFTPSFAQRIANHISIPFKEAKSGDEVLPGHGNLAPGDFHMILLSPPSQPDRRMIRLSKIPNNTLHTPSVDITMISVLEHYGASTIGVLLTGMGADRADAMVSIRKSGGQTIDESEETAVVFGMPKEAIRRGGADYVLPLHKIGEKIVEQVLANKPRRN